MSDQDKQFVEAVIRWRTTDERDARIAALEAENARLQETVNGLDRQNDYLAEEIARLTDELDAIKAQKPGTWTVPTPDPDVSGLVEALKEARTFTLEHDSGRAGYVRGRIDAALAAHKAGGSIQCPASHPAECYAPGTHVVHASLVHGIVRQADALSAALSAVTAERDRLESTLIQTTTRHFAKQWKDCADDKKLDECLSEGIAMLDAERDALREALKECAASLAWNCFGECRAIHAGPIMPAAKALEIAKAALAASTGQEVKP